jgi:hypothetical protein
MVSLGRSAEGLARVVAIPYLQAAPKGSPLSRAGRTIVARTRDTRGARWPSRRNARRSTSPTFPTVNSRTALATDFWCEAIPLRKSLPVGWGWARPGTNLAIERNDYRAATDGASEKRTVSVVSCARCGREMLPRLIVGPRIFPGRHWTPIPLRSVCPFCAATYFRFYSPMRDLCGRLIVRLALLLLLAIAVRGIAHAKLQERAHRWSGGSSLSPNSSANAVPRKH